jgi:hypothetical protein
MREESLQPGVAKQFGVEKTVHAPQTSLAANLLKKVVTQRCFSLGRRHRSNPFGFLVRRQSSDMALMEY